MKNDNKNNKKFIDPDKVEIIKDNKKVLKKRGNNNYQHNKNNNSKNNNYKKNNYNKPNNNSHKEYKEPKIIKKPKIIDENEKIIIKPKELDIIDNNEELHVFEDYNENDIVLNFNNDVDTDSIVKEAIKKEKEELKKEIKEPEKIEVKKEEPVIVKEVKKPIKKKKKINIGKIIITLILLICLATFGYSIYNIVLWKIDTDNTEEVYSNIQSKVTMTETVIETPSITESVTESAVKEHKFNPYFDYIDTNMLSVDISELIKENKDTTGWIKLEGTSINYPFVRSSDNDYYLTHSFNKSYNVSGWIFLDYRNDKDITKNKNSIIYGHRRSDRAMFGSLKTVLTKDWQKNTSNHYIKISLEHYNLLYKVFSVYHVPVTSDYIQTDFDDGEFQEFLNMIKNRSAYNFYTDVDESDSILTLSSCYGNNERVVVHAKLVQKQGK